MYWFYKVLFFKLIYTFSNSKSILVSSDNFVNLPSSFLKRKVKLTKIIINLKIITPKTGNLLQIFTVGL